MATKIKEIKLPGDMTIYEAAENKEFFSDVLSGISSLNVNLSNVAEIDSSGIQLMVALKKEAADEEKSISFISHSQAVVDLLDLFDLTSYFGDPIIMENRG